MGRGDVVSYELIHGDCLDVLPTLEAGSVDLCLTDPPYGTTACKWDAVIPFEPMWAGIKHVIKPNAAVVLFGSQPFTSALVMSNPAWFRCEWVWEKSRPSGFLDAGRKPLKAHENVVVFYGSQPVYNPQMETGQPCHIRPGVPPKYRNNLYGDFKPAAGRITTQKFPRSIVKVKSLDASLSLHPTQKPVALLEYLIRTYTNEGDTVLDFTMGSGSTGVACLNTGRRFIGIEKDAAYFAIAQDRLAAASQQLRIAV